MRKRRALPYHRDDSSTGGRPPGVLSREIAFDVKSKTEERAAGQETSHAGRFDGFWCFGRCDSVIFLMFRGSLVFSVACFFFGGQRFGRFQMLLVDYFCLCWVFRVLRWFVMLVGTIVCSV